MMDKSNSQLHVCHVNVENLRVHKESFINLYQNRFYDIIAISETFLKPEILSTLYQLNGYSFVGHDRLGKEGGDIAVYVNNQVSYRVISSIEYRVISLNSYTIKKTEYMFLNVQIDHGQNAVSGLSYHDFIYVVINLKLRPRITKELIAVMVFKNININNISNDIRTVSWDDVYNADTLDKKVDLLNDKFLVLITSTFLKNELILTGIPVLG